MCYQEALPIQSFKYGLMSSPLQNATITIGPLECYTLEQQPELTNVYVTNSYTDYPYAPEYDSTPPSYYDGFGCGVNDNCGWD